MLGLAEQRKLGQARRCKGQRPRHCTGWIAQRRPRSTRTGPRPQLQRLTFQTSHVGIGIVHSDRQRAAELAHRFAKAESVQLYGERPTPLLSMTQEIPKPYGHLGQMTLDVAHDVVPGVQATGSQN